jgi:cytochrome c5
MSEVHLEEHSSPIRTPKQLITVVLLAFLVPIVLIATLAYLLTSGLDRSKDNPVQAEEAIARRIKPVGVVEVVDANAPKVEKTGPQVVEAVCSACHATGALDAPKIGDRAAWAKLLQQGLPKLTQAAIKGAGNMPPRGGSPDLSDSEIARAIVHMANQSGGNLKEPAQPPVTAAGASAAATPAAAAAAPSAPSVASKQAAATASAPVIAAAVPAKADAGKGKAVYDSTCSVCHAAGIAGAPQTGDKAAWAPRLKAGIDALHASSIKGKGAMPPKGGNLTLPDADVKAAVDYMAGLAK